jgi:hypothetical protein
VVAFDFEFSAELESVVGDELGIGVGDGVGFANLAVSGINSESTK